MPPEYQDVNRPSASSQTIKHSVTHHIVTTNPPIYSKPRRLSPEKLKIPKKEFDVLSVEDICPPSKNESPSPLHSIDKRNQEWRPCNDYRRINTVTTQESRSPKPQIQDPTQTLQQGK